MTQSKFSSKFDPEESCINFLLNKVPSNDAYQSYAKIVRDQGLDITLNGSPCHASYVKAAEGDPIVVCSGITASKERKDVIERFWQWVSGPRSPWKILFENGLTAVKSKDDIYKGWVLAGKDNLKKVPFNLHKNFAILCRSLSEHKHAWDLWHHLVTVKGMQEVDAWYLISVFTPYQDARQFGDPKAVFEGLTARDVRGGGHWALTDASPGISVYNGATSVTRPRAIFNFKRARTGEVNLLPVPQINGFFCDTIEDYKGWNPVSTISKTKIGGSFSAAAYYKTDDVIEDLYKWQDQESILA